EGIDLVCYTRNGSLECDFVALSGTDPGRIHLALDGASHAELDPSGNLLLHVGERDVHVRKPNAFQLNRGGRNSIDIGYVLNDFNEIGFRIGEYNHDIPLIIMSH